MPCFYSILFINFSLFGLIFQLSLSLFWYRTPTQEDVRSQFLDEWIRSVGLSISLSPSSDVLPSATMFLCIWRKGLLLMLEFCRWWAQKKLLSSTLLSSTLFCKCCSHSNRCCHISSMFRADHENSARIQRHSFSWYKCLAKNWKTLFAWMK